MVLILASMLANAAPVDEYASKPDWACSYGKETQTCGGPALFGEVETQQTVKLCGASQVVCERTWRLSAERESLLEVLPTWAETLEEQVAANGWRVAVGLTPQAWYAKRWGPDEQATVEVGEDYLIARILPRTHCDRRDIIKRTDRLVYPLADAGIVETWPEVALTRIEHMDDRALELVREHGQEEFSETSQDRRRLIGSDELQCYLELNNRRDVMEGVRELFGDWARWRNPTPAELRQRRRDERQLAREAEKRNDRDVEGEDLEDVPDDNLRAAGGQSDWPAGH